MSNSFQKKPNRRGFLLGAGAFLSLTQIPGKTATATITRATGAPLSLLPKKPLIVLDAGHGGQDSGAKSPYNARVLEKNINLQCVLFMAEALQNSGRARVLLTRSDDSFVDLEQRVVIARRAEADLFVSIHVDSTESKYTHLSGFTCYTRKNYYQYQDSVKTLDLAPGENVAKAVSAAKEQHIYALADARETQLRIVSNLQAKGVRFGQNPVRSDDFQVFRGPDMPSVLFEIGYINNAADFALLNNPQSLKEYAFKLAEAVEEEATHPFFRKNLKFYSGPKPPRPHGIQSASKALTAS